MSVGVVEVSEALWWEWKSRVVVVEGFWVHRVVGIVVVVLELEKEVKRAPC